MARKSHTPATSAPARRLSCGCVRQDVVDAGRHQRGCAGWPHPQGCDSLDCAGDCLVTGNDCDGDDDDG